MWKGVLVGGICFLCMSLDFGALVVVVVGCWDDCKLFFFGFRFSYSFPLES